MYYVDQFYFSFTIFTLVLIHLPICTAHLYAYNKPKYMRTKSGKQPFYRKFIVDILLLYWVKCVMCIVASATKIASLALFQICHVLLFTRMFFIRQMQMATVCVCRFSCFFLWSLYLLFHLLIQFEYITILNDSS